MESLSYSIGLGRRVRCLFLVGEDDTPHEREIALKDL
jgi:hypothetical protein